MQINLDDAKTLGVFRNGTHAGAAGGGTPRYYPSDSTAENVTGSAAELAFAAWSGIPITPPHPESHGDGGVDFRHVMNGRAISLDVKGARIPKYLLVKEAKGGQAADIFVLAYVNGSQVEFIGWEHRSIMLLMPVAKFGFDMCHFRDAFLLRPMFQLKHLLSA